MTSSRRIYKVRVVFCFSISSGDATKTTPMDFKIPQFAPFFTTVGNLSSRAPRQSWRHPSIHFHRMEIACSEL